LFTSLHNLLAKSRFFIGQREPVKKISLKKLTTSHPENSNGSQNLPFSRATHTGLRYSVFRSYARRKSMTYQR